VEQIAQDACSMEKYQIVFVAKLICSISKILE